MGGGCALGDHGEGIQVPLFDRDGSLMGTDHPVAAPGGFVVCPFKGLQSPHFISGGVANLSTSKCCSTSITWVAVVAHLAHA